MIFKLVLCSIDRSSCLRRPRKSEANGRRDRAWFQEVREEYRQRCRIAIAAAIAAAAAAAAAAVLLLLLLLLLLLQLLPVLLLLLLAAAAASSCSCCCCGGIVGGAGYRFHMMEKPSPPRRRP